MIKAKYRPITLSQLRATVSYDARILLDRMWEYYCDQNEGMPSFPLHAKFGGKESVLSTLAPLGGTVVRLGFDNTKNRYRITIIGALLTSHGDVAEDLLIRYLEYARQRYLTNPEETKITSIDLERDLSLSPKDSHFLKKLIFISPFSGGGSYSQKIGEPWHVEIPLVLEDAPHAGSLNEFFNAQIMAGYNPNIPISDRPVNTEEENTGGIGVVHKRTSRADGSVAVSKRLPRRVASGKGTILETAFGKYTIGNSLGEGGAGRVFEATDDGGPNYAIKLLDPQKTTVDKRRRFRNEIIFGVKNDHKNIIRIIDHGLYKDEKGEAPFYVMPLYKGTLRKLMKSGISKEKVLSYFAQLLDGIEAAHLKGITHRDVKPENVLCDPDSSLLVVADFGIAQFNEEELYTLVETKAWDRLANFQYAAPEQRERG